MSTSIFRGSPEPRPKKKLVTFSLPIETIALIKKLKKRHALFEWQVIDQAIVHAWELEPKRGGK